MANKSDELLKKIMQEGKIPEELCTEEEMLSMISKELVADLSLSKRIRRATGTMGGDKHAAPPPPPAKGKLPGGKGKGSGKPGKGSGKVGKNVHCL